MVSSSTSLKPLLPSSSSDGNPGLPGKNEIDRHANAIEMLENQFGETEEFKGNAMRDELMTNGIKWAAQYRTFGDHDHVAIDGGGVDDEELDGADEEEKREVAEGSGPALLAPAPRQLHLRIFFFFSCCCCSTTTTGSFTTIKTAEPLRCA
jgi:hypothetical protein